MLVFMRHGHSSAIFSFVSSIFLLFSILSLAFLNFYLFGECWDLIINNFLGLFHKVPKYKSLKNIDEKADKKAENNLQLAISFCFSLFSCVPAGLYQNYKFISFMIPEFSGG